jgi:hypothetical protein
LVHLTLPLYSAGSPTVRYGTTSGSYSLSVAAISFTYTRQQMCGSPATTIGFRDPGVFHTAVIKGLAPSTRVYYVFGTSADGYSSEYYFDMAPLPGSPVNAIAFGDLGQHVLDHSLQQEVSRRREVDPVKHSCPDSHECCAVEPTIVNLSARVRLSPTFVFFQ